MTISEITVKETLTGTVSSTATLEGSATVKNGLTGGLNYVSVPSLITGVDVNGVPQPIENKIVMVDVPTLPDGGDAGQVLGKASNDDFDTTWITVDGLPTVSSVFGRIGIVTAQTNDYNADQINDTSTTKKFVTSTEKTKLANLSGVNTGDQDLSGYATITYVDDSIENIELTPGPAGQDGASGADGKSAYQVWLDLGNTGNEAAFIASLKGVDGEPGTDGANGTNGSDGTDGSNGREIELQKSSTHVQWRYIGDTVWNNLVAVADITGANGQDGINGLNGIDGDDGLSAYQIWLNLGNTGTEQDFINSLQGEDGIDGTNGSNGTNGTDGADGASAYEIAVANGFTGTELEWLASLEGQDGLTTSVNEIEQVDGNITLTLDNILDGEDRAWGDKQDALGFTPENAANKGIAGGYPALDGGGKILLANLPSTLLKYVGTWNANTNTPELTNPDTTKKGNVYVISEAGTRFGISFKLGDWLIYNDSGIPEKADNSDDVVSVNSKTGTIVLDTDDLSDTDKTHKFITSTERTTWNAKADTLILNTNSVPYNSTTDLGIANTSIQVSEIASNDTLVIRDTDGCIQVGAPTTGGHATTKTYVDNGLSGKLAKVTNVTAINDTGIADGEIVVFNLTNKDIRTSDKTIVTTLGTTDATIPTSKAVMDAIDAAYGTVMGGSY